jgi:hypothetical protein
MHVRNALLAAPLALAVVACGGTSQTPSAALDAATPTYAALSMDQVSTDTTPGAPATALTAPVLQGDCHPHLFIRQREVVERVNRHIYKALRHVEAVLARNPLTSTDDSKTWDHVDNGIERKFTIRLVSADVYAWELDVGPAGAPAAAMTGQIDRTGATGPHQGKGFFDIDFAKLHAGFPAEPVAQGALHVDFDVAAASRKITAIATNVAWDLDTSMFAMFSDSARVMTTLSTPRSGSYVYFREPGKGGSLKLQDQMVFLCPANAGLVPADAQLVSRWYRTTDGSVHGRSDALMQHGQLPADGIDHVVGVTCHQGSSDGGDQAEGFWMMKAEDASGNTIQSASVSTGATPCDPVFGDVPLAGDATKDFTFPTSYSDGIPFPFPSM